MLYDLRQVSITKEFIETVSKQAFYLGSEFCNLGYTVPGKILTLCPEEDKVGVE